MPSQPDSVWARPGQDATQESPPGHGGTQEWPGTGEAPGAAEPPGAREAPGWGSQPAWSAPEGWGRQPGPAAPRGWQPGWVPPAPSAPPGPPRRAPGRTRLVVGAGIALLLVVAAVAVLGLRGAGGEPTASPGTSALVPGAGGGGTGGGGGAGPGGGSAGGGAGGGGNGATGAGSLRLPDRVGGMARIPIDDSSLLQGQQGLLDMVTASGGLDGWGLGAYGPGRDDPRFALLVVKTSQAGTADLIASGMVDAVREGLGGAGSSPRTFTRSGVRYDCWDGSLGGLCSFQDGPTVGLGFSRDTDLGRLSQLTDDARRGVRG